MKYLFKLIKYLILFIICFVILISLVKTPIIACEIINNDVLINQAVKDIQDHMGSQESLRYYGSLPLYIPDVDLEIRFITSFFKHTSKDITFIREFLTNLDWDSLIKKHGNDTSSLRINVIEDYCEYFNTVEQGHNETTYNVDIILVQENAKTFLIEFAETLKISPLRKAQIINPKFIQDIILNIDWITYIKTVDYSSGDLLLLKKIYIAKMHLMSINETKIINDILFISKNGIELTIHGITNYTYNKLIKANPFELANNFYTTYGIIHDWRTVCPITYINNHLVIIPMGQNNFYNQAMINPAIFQHLATPQYYEQVKATHNMEKALDITKKLLSYFHFTFEDNALEIHYTVLFEAKITFSKSYPFISLTIING